MNSGIQPILISNLDGLSYAVIFLIAFLAGYLVPAPEEVVFVLLGYLAVFQDINIFLIILVSISGVVLADNIVYYLGLKGSFVVDKAKHRMDQVQVAKYENMIHQFAGRTIFTSRFIPTIRVLVPAVAGSVKVGWRTFFLFELHNHIDIRGRIERFQETADWEGRPAVLDVGGLILIGYIFENRVSRVLSTVQTTRHILSIFSLVIIGTIISLAIRSIFFKKDK